MGKSWVVNTSEATPIISNNEFDSLPITEPHIAKLNRNHTE